MATLPDPRTFRKLEDAPAAAARWYALVQHSLDASTAGATSVADAELRCLLGAAILDDAAALEDAIFDAPSPAVARHLWREVDQAWRDLPQVLGPELALALTLFALPIVIVAGVLDGQAATDRALNRGSAGAVADAVDAATRETTTGRTAGGVGASTREAGDEIILPGTLPEVSGIGAILRAGRALAGNENFVVANALTSARCLRIGQLAAWYRWQQQQLSPGNASGSMEQCDLLAPAPITVSPANEAAHLRFLVGSALAAPAADLLADVGVSIWGAPLARELIRLMSHARVSVLALPRAPGRPLPAHHRGLSAQREVSAQLFAANAIRRLRASVGEPSAVISAHQCPTAPGGGELRLSLSSPFEPRDAEGFCCPIYAIERVNDVALMLTDLMADCRVADVRLAPGVHPDRVQQTHLRDGETPMRLKGTEMRLGGTAMPLGATDMPLLFKPETIPGAFR